MLLTCLLAGLLSSSEAFAAVTADWTRYRVGANDCHMRAVDPVSGMVVYGGSDCTPKAARTIQAKLTRAVTLPDGTRIEARIVSDAPAAASSPTQKLEALFPGSAMLRLVQCDGRGDEVILAETYGTAREILGVAANADASAVVVVFRYEKTLREKNDARYALDVLGLDLRARRAALAHDP